MGRRKREEEAAVMGRRRQWQWGRRGGGGGGGGGGGELVFRVAFSNKHNEIIATNLCFVLNKISIQYIVCHHSFFDKCYVIRITRKKRIHR